MLTNAQSLRNKIEELELLLTANMVDLAAVTGLMKLPFHSAIIPGFTCFSKNRQNGRGVGVAKYAKDNMNVRPVSNHSCEFECLWIRRDLKQIGHSTSNLYICVNYCSPGSTYEEILQHVFHTVDDVWTRDFSAIFTIMGDFNHLQTTTIETNLGMTQLIYFLSAKMLFWTRSLQTLQYHLLNLHPCQAFCWAAIPNKL